MQTVGPLNRNVISTRRRNQAERHILRLRAMPLSVEIHLSAELAVHARILARHVVHVIGGARFDAVRLPALDNCRQALPLTWIRRGSEQRLAARGGQGVAERGEGGEEEEEDEEEEEEGDDV